MQQADDFRAESDALSELLEPLADNGWRTPTLFKAWTIDDILQHLHFFNEMADLSLTEPERFEAAYSRLTALRNRGMSFVRATDTLLEGLHGRTLFDAWRETYPVVAAHFAEADPKQRVQWAGPGMSARSSITARQMETWAHGQAIFDVLDVDRIDTDRIRNIAHLGVATFGWTFRNRGEAVPEPVPHVALEAPSGASWAWGEPRADERVSGPATAFCQVVCQTRNIADTALQVTGPVATRWMSLAQCFAGPPHDPPPPGTRKKSATEIGTADR